MVVLGFGGTSFDFQAMDESWMSTYADNVVQVGALTTLAMSGVDSVSIPTILIL